MSRTAALVSVQWLAETLTAGAPNIRVLDCSWHMPFSKRNGRKEYNEKHIPEALFFDIDECCDKTIDLPHMLPKADDFENYVGNLGINNRTHVIVYDNNATLGLFSAQRVWWTFRVFGHEAVSVLDGGFPHWLDADYAYTDEIPKFPREVFKATMHAELVKYFEDIENNLKANHANFQVIDARPSGRFNGTSPEPRPDVKPGHIPGSISIPFTSVVDPSTKLWKNPEQLKQMFDDANIDLSKPLVASCGSGVTACTLALAAYTCGKEDVSIYDGAWTEWYFKAPADEKEGVPV